jgi:hypothetical protein
LGIREKVLLQYRLREIEYTKFAKNSSVKYAQGIGAAPEAFPVGELLGVFLVMIKMALRAA